MKNIAALFIGGMSRAKGIMLVAALAAIGIALISINIMSGSNAPSIIAIKLGVIDRDMSLSSADFQTYLTRDLGIELVHSNDVDAMNTELVEKRISGLIEIPDGFEEELLSGSHKPMRITFMGDYANEAFTRGYIESYMQSLGIAMSMASGDAAGLETMLELAGSERITVTTTEKDVTAIRAQMDKDSYGIMISFFLMFSFIMSINIATMLYSDRMAGTYRRIKAGRVTSFEYVASVAAIGGILMLVIDGPSLVLYAFLGGDPGVPIFATAGLLAIYSMFVIAFGILVGLVAKGQGGIVAIVIAITTITSLLGGAFFPIDTAPQVFQVIGKITPQYWFFQAVDAWQTGASSPAGPALVILLVAALLFVLSGVQFTTNKSLARI